MQNVISHKIPSCDIYGIPKRKNELYEQHEHTYIRKGGGRNWGGLDIYYVQ
jgi:hypothetical protein